MEPKHETIKTENYGKVIEEYFAQNPDELSLTITVHRMLIPQPHITHVTWFNFNLDDICTPDA